MQVNTVTHRARSHTHHICRMFKHQSPDHTKMRQSQWWWNTAKQCHLISDKWMTKARMRTDTGSDIIIMGKVFGAHPCSISFKSNACTGDHGCKCNEKVTITSIQASAFWMDKQWPKCQWIHRSKISPGCTFFMDNILQKWQWQCDSLCFYSCYILSNIGVACMLARAHFGARVMQNLYKVIRMLQKCRSGRTNRLYIFIYIYIYIYHNLLPVGISWLLICKNNKN